MWAGRKKTGSWFYRLFFPTFYNFGVDRYDNIFICSFIEIKNNKEIIVQELIYLSFKRVTVGSKVL